jgi:hypothetical protein
VWKTVGFLLAWSALNAMLNVRYPEDDPPASYLLPSLDIAAMFSVFAAFALIREYAGRRFPLIAAATIPKLVVVLLAAWVLFMRVYRVGDGVMGVWQSRSANMFSDISMLGEVTRLLYASLPPFTFVLTATGVTLAVPLVIWITFRALMVGVHYLSTPKHIGIFAVVLGICAALSPLGSRLEYPERYTGLFVSSLVPRIRQDIKEFYNDKRLRQARLAHAESAKNKLAASSGDLAKLGGANVLLFIVESYGEYALANPEISRHMDEAYADYEAMLDDGGFAAASRVMNSPVIGGFSWLAHASLFTGMRVTDQGHYEFIRGLQPKTLVDYFSGAGYRTVTGEPGTTRPFEPPLLYNFDVKFYSWHFRYQGPKYSWAPMPDQFVIDNVHRRAIRSHKGPQFVKFALVSSHGPWDLQPPLIANWSRIRNGEVYNESEPLTYPTSWTDLSNAEWPYTRSILYTLDVIRRYIDEFVDDDSLIIMIGDHQPTPKLTGNLRSRGVPIHVISRNEEVVNTFVEKRGYTFGMRPDVATPRPGIWTFPGDLLEDFSNP